MMHDHFSCFGIKIHVGRSIEEKISVPCVASTETSTYLLLALVKGATDYPDYAVTVQEKGWGGGVKGRGAGSE